MCIDDQIVNSYIITITCLYIYIYIYVCMIFSCRISLFFIYKMTVFMLYYHSHFSTDHKNISSLSCFFISKKKCSVSVEDLYLVGYNSEFIVIGILQNLQCSTNCITQLIFHIYISVSRVSFHIPFKPC